MSTVDSGNGFGTRVFWTAVIPDDDVQVHFGDGTAEMHVHNLGVFDYFSALPTGGAGNISLGPNWQTAAVDAVVSFDVVWNGPVTRDIKVRDTTYGFAGQFLENQATVSWSVQSSSGFSFTSNPGDFSTSLPEVPGVNGVTQPLNFFAQIGKERNGIFFPVDSRQIGAHGTDDLNLTTATEEAPSDIDASDLVHALLVAAPRAAVPKPASLADHQGERLAGTRSNLNWPTQNSAPADPLSGGTALAPQLDQAFAGQFVDAFSTLEGYLWAR